VTDCFAVKKEYALVSYVDMFSLLIYYMYQAVTNIISVLVIFIHPFISFS
jgi:hypothetical protein